MQIQRLWREVRSPRTQRIAGIALGVAVVFSLGVLTGNGHLRVVPRSGFSDQTGLPRSLDYSSLNQIYDALRENYDGKLTQQQVLDGLKHGLAQAAGDPYTVYFTPAEAKNFNGQLQGVSLTGIGAQLDSDASGNVVVMSPLKGSPAAAAGILAKDVILSIDGQPTAGMSVNTAVGKIRGPKGSKVTLVVQRGDQQLTFTITRDTISVPTASSKILDNHIGYLQVGQFSDDTYGLTQQAVADFKKAGVTKVVLDLRDNPGGEVDSAQNIASLWLPSDAVVMQEKRGDKVVDSYKATGTNPLLGMPTVVLINGGSASASEITALALRDAKAGYLIGEKSYGKGVVQSVLPFSDGGELKVTIAKWYSPKGTSINHQGITPDQTVAAGTNANADPQLDAAEAYLNK